MLTIIIAILIFGILIGIHEAGHLIAAKACGVLVHEFAVGMGPKLFSFRKGETLYSLRLIPIGGFCNLEGEDGESDSNRAFCNKHPLKKILILVSGALMNILLGFIAICIIFAHSDYLPTTKIESVDFQAPAYTQGLKAGDEIVKINSKRVFVKTDIDNELYFSKDNDINLLVRRDGEILNIIVSPYYKDGNKMIGITLSTDNNNFFNLVVFSFKYLISMCRIILSSLWMLITGAVSFKETSGPVGIVTVIGQAASGPVNQMMFLRVLNILSLITINLGLFNLIPLPALDGGRTFLAFIELITRKKIPAKFETIFHSTGMILLLILMVFVTFNDVMRLF